MQQNKLTVDEKFGQAVSLVRAAKGLSQRDLAALLKEKGMQVDASAISRIEKGTRSLRVVEAVYLSEALETELSVLAGGVGDPTEAGALLDRLTAAIDDSRTNRARLFKVVDAYESVRAYAKNLMKDVELFNGELASPGTMDAGRVRFMLEQLETLAENPTDVVVHEYLGTQDVEHKEAP